MTRVAIAISRFNADITEGLLRGARAELETAGLPLRETDIITAPGAFELPLIAQTLALTGRYGGVVCLGCVIKGDTAHFEFISLGATMGLMAATLATRVPISFGILTTYDETQAIARSADDAENKGREAARACVESIGILEQLANDDESIVSRAD